ncbi:MAG: polymer-forming cytoskeletal protein [Anaerolineaceae bacterium]|nr:polymer-forming cytoskeletal protein [Anaerolineaceae bacterium]
MKKIGLLLGLMLVMLLWPAGAVLADGPVVQQDGGRVYFDEDVTLEPGEVTRGSLGLVNGDLTVPAGSTVRGDVFVTNGDADIAGRVEGNVAVVSGDLTLASGSEVRGDVLTTAGSADMAGIVMGDVSTMFGDLHLRGSAALHGNLTVVSGTMVRDEGAQVLGETIPDLKLPRLRELERALPIVPAVPVIPPVPEIRPIPEIPPVPEIPAVPAVPIRPHRDSFGHQAGRFMARAMGAGLMTLLAVAVGLLLVLIWPRQVRRVGECITLMPLQSLGLGLLTLLLAAGLEALAAVLMILIILVAALLMSTVVLIPIGLLLLLLAGLVLLPVPLALVGAVMLGWVGLAEVVGQRVLHALKAREIKTLGSVLVGMLLTGALVAMLWIVEPVCCGWLLAVLLSSVGLGAAFHTRFGRQPCQRGQAVAPAGDTLPPEAMDDEAGEPDVPAAP